MKIISPFGPKIAKLKFSNKLIKKSTKSIKRSKKIDKNLEIIKIFRTKLIISKKIKN